MTNGAVPEVVATMDEAVPAPGRIRLLGAAVGAVVGAGALALLWLASAIIGDADIAILDLVAGPDGILSATGGAPGIWIAPVAATALAGGLLAVRAARRRPWSGALMGFVAYGLGVIIGSLLVAILLGTETDPVDAVGFGPAQALGATFLFIPFGAIVLAPLLAVCVAAGILWAAVVRAAVPAPAVAESAARSTALAITLVVVGGTLGALWLIAMWFLDLLAATTPGS